MQQSSEQNIPTPDARFLAAYWINLIAPITEFTRSIFRISKKIRQLPICCQSKAPPAPLEVPAPEVEVATPAQQADVADEVETEVQEPRVMHALTLPQNEKNKVRRVVTPKPMTGHLEVSQDIFNMWQTKDGKQKLYALWAKAGGVKVGCLKTQLSWPRFRIFQ